MADGFLYISDADHSEILQRAVSNGVKEISIFFEGDNVNIPSSHPKALKADLLTKANGPLSIDLLKITRNGNILIVTRDFNTADRLLKINQILDIPVKAKLSMESISTKFLLFNIHHSTTSKDIKEELEENNIHAYEVRRFLKYSNKIPSPTGTVLVTMLGTSLPNSVNLWYQHHSISMFIDRPRRCTNCCKFTHSTKSCKQARACMKCGEEHDSVNCSNPTIKCANCNAPHQADDKNCPAYKKEQQILNFKCQHHLTLGEARRRFHENEKSTTNKSYALATQEGVAKGYASKNDLEALNKEFSARIADLSKSLLLTLTNNLNQIAESISEKIFTTINQLTTKILEPKSTLSADNNTNEKNDLKETDTKTDHADSSDEDISSKTTTDSELQSKNITQKSKSTNSNNCKRPIRHR